MKKMLVGLVGLWLCSMAALADTVVLKDGHPDTYTVQKGDTLWDISARFLQDPWLWSDIWDVNPEIENPHLIYPGDVIRLVWKDGQPRLTLARGEGSRTVKLGPQVRIEPIDAAIPAIPFDQISAWLRRNLIVTAASLEKAPYVVASEDARIVAGAGDRAFVRGDLPQDQGRLYGIYRRGETLRDPETKELLGVEARAIGVGYREDSEKDIHTLALNEAHEEVRVGDRVFQYRAEDLTPKFMPSRPDGTVEGNIIGAEGAVSSIGRYTMVTLDRGERNGLKPGTVLAIYNRGAKIKDIVSKETVKLPDERAGLLMVVRSFEKASYGIILVANRPMSVGDIVKNP